MARLVFWGKRLVFSFGLALITKALIVMLATSPGATKPGDLQRSGE